MRKPIFYLFLVAALLLAGCDNALRAGGVQSQCQTAGKTGSCTITIGSLEGETYSRQVKSSAFRAGDQAADVTLSVTVETGGVTVSLEGPDDAQTSVDVKAGETAELSGQATILGTGDDRYFRVYLKPLGEGETPRAENIRVDLQYTVP